MIEGPVMCESCHEYPKIEMVAEHDIIYCSFACRNDDAIRHQKLCKRYAKRRAFVGAAQLLRRARMAHHETAYEEIIEGFEFLDHDSDEIARFYLQVRPYETEAIQRGLFVAQSIGKIPGLNVEQRDAALATMTCTRARAYCHPLALRLLAPIGSKVEELSVKIQERRFEVRGFEVRSNAVALIVSGNPNLTEMSEVPQISKSSNRLDLVQYTEHISYVVLQISSESESHSWVVDPTGAQYGFLHTEALYAWVRGRYLLKGTGNDGIDADVKASIHGMGSMLVAKITTHYGAHHKVCLLKEDGWVFLQMLKDLKQADRWFAQVTERWAERKGGELQHILFTRLQDFEECAKDLEETVRLELSALIRKENEKCGRWALRLRLTKAWRQLKGQEVN